MSIMVVGTGRSCDQASWSHNEALWHDLPERYGNRKTVQKRFTRWARAGVWEHVFAHLLEDPDNDYSASIQALCGLISGRQQEMVRPKGEQALGRYR